MFERLFIEKRPEFRHCAAELAHLKTRLGLPRVEQLRRIVIYDLFDCPPELLSLAKARVFADPVSDEILPALPSADFSLIIEPLPAQFDQRADSAAQCLQLLDSRFADVSITTAQAWLFYGELSAAEQQQLRAHLLNPIEAREKDLALQQRPQHAEAGDVTRYEDFLSLNETALQKWHGEQGLAMTLADLKLVQNYFQNEARAPTETEIRVLDTYWSDHCRHTTFMTELEKITFPTSAFGAALEGDFADYQQQRYAVYGDKVQTRPYSLMDLATIDAKYQRAQGNLADVEVSAEVNACSVWIDVDEDGETAPWLLQFKNETHNHPTEIEPFGGAATCIGGAIRDPLSGRAYVYQAMRLSGSADPREELHATLEGKLPQIIIALGAAAGASSYGNQIGLATGQVVEVYHEGYKAKHLEVGAVVAATPAAHVKREEPAAGDVVLLLGGATGRDGCGGATGSSRAQHGSSLAESAAEVQKGNPPEERKLQRLFRQAAFASKIKRCNDFGAGGVAVAIGELADGLAIELDSIPVKYQGLSGTELAISESQERMAIVVAPEDVAELIELAAQENLTATKIAEVTAEPLLIMRWRGAEIVHLKRSFLDSNGAQATQKSVNITEPSGNNPLQIDSPSDWLSALKTQLGQLAFADQRGLGDRFDFSVGASCVLLPYGGKTMRTPVEASVYALPTEGKTHTASILAYGFEPNISAWSPYHGGLLAVIEATARFVATGGDAQKVHFSLQEYFRRLGTSPDNWGLPYAALLGAHHALSGLARAAIGGKDSMSGSFDERHVPPTLIAFAVGTVDTRQVVSPEFKATDHYLYWLRCPADALGRPDLAVFQQNNAFLWKKIHMGKLYSARAVRAGGVIQAIYEGSLGNNIGVDIAELHDAFTPEYGGYLISSAEELSERENLYLLGKTTAENTLKINGKTAEIEELYAISTQVLGDVYPLYSAAKDNKDHLNQPPLATTAKTPAIHFAPTKTPKPRVCLPVFYGTNSELDTARAFRRAGGMVTEAIIRNRHAQDIHDSLSELVTQINNSQIFVLAGGFSAGDEPDGSGKFIANVLTNPKVAAAMDDFLARDGLILGICNGFQALVKSGLLPNGKIHTPSAGDATLTHNLIGRHIARVATTVVANNFSPWLRDFAIGEAHDVLFSHGEGRFVASEAVLDHLQKTGQIAFQYADPNSLLPSMKPVYNPNGSMLAIEGITSPCGKILGKMGHSERHQSSGQQNYPDFRAQDIFTAGVQAFQ